MNRSLHVLPLVSLLLGSMALGGCKKEEPEPLAIPAPSAAPVKVLADTPAPPDSAAAAAASAAAVAASTAASAAAVPSSGTAAPSPAAPPAAAGGGSSIDACCSALAAVQSSGKPATVKSKAAAAASVCGAIAKLVKTGQTSRAAALTQIKSALVGTTPPAECN